VSRVNSNIRSQLINFFIEYDALQKHLYLNKCLEQLSSEDPSILEILGIIFKYLNNDDKNLIINAILKLDVSIHSEFCVNFFNFYRFTMNDLSDEISKKFIDILNELKTKEIFNNTIDYLINMKNEKPAFNENSKVLLLIPEFQSSISFLQPPIDYMTVVALLKSYNIACDILDNRVFNYSIEKVLNLIKQYDLIFITSTPIDMMQKYYIDYRYAVFCNNVSNILSYYPRKQIYIVGPHGTVDCDLLCNDINIEKKNIIKGEFEQKIVSIVLEHLHKEDNIKDVTLFMPDYNSVHIKWYFGREYKNNICTYQPNMTIMQISKGCPYRCKFCYNFYGKTVKYKSFDAIIKEFSILRTLGISEIFFIDQTFTLNKKLLTKICNYLIKNDYHFSWQCETRADLLDYELVKLMKQAGCKSIWLGIESFSQELLDINNKDIDLFKIYDALKICKEANMNLCGFIMFGMPGETNITINQTISEIKRLKLRISPSVNSCEPRIGSDLYASMKESGIKIKSFFDLNKYKGTYCNQITNEDIKKAEKELLLYWRVHYLNEN